MTDISYVLLIYWFPTCKHAVKYRSRTQLICLVVLTACACSRKLYTFLFPLIAFVPFMSWYIWHINSMCMIDINVNKCCLERRLFTVTVVEQSCSLYTIEVENKTVKNCPVYWVICLWSFRNNIDQLYNFVK